MAAGRLADGRYLYEVEVVEQADPDNTGQHVKPDGDFNRIDAGGAKPQHYQDGQDKA
jgi:hypothetical protein